MSSTEIWLPEGYMPRPGERLAADSLRVLIVDLAERASRLSSRDEGPWQRQFADGAARRAEYAAKALEDGQTADAELEFWRAVACLRGAMEIIRGLHELGDKVSQVHKARLPRKPVTRDDLLKFRDQYRKKAGKERGWKTAAAIEFGVSTETLRERLRTTKEN